MTEEVWQLLAEVAPNRGLPAAATSKEGVPRKAFASRLAVGRYRATGRANRTTVRRFPGGARGLREIRQRQNIPQREDVTFAVRCEPGDRRIASADAALFPANGPRHGHCLGARRDRARRRSQSHDCRPARDHRSSCRREPLHRCWGRDASGSKKIAKTSPSRSSRSTASSRIQASSTKRPPKSSSKQRDKLAELREQLVSVEAAMKKLGDSQA